MSTQMSPKRKELLGLLAAQTVAVTCAHLYSLSTTLQHATETNQYLGGMRSAGLVKNEDGPGALLWSITDAGREALEEPKAPARKKPKKPAKRARAARAEQITEAADDAPEPEHEIDFGLWASGVLTIEFEDETKNVPAKDVARLRDYLNKHAPKSMVYMGALEELFIIEARATPGIVRDLNLSNRSAPTGGKFSQFIENQVREGASSQPPAPPIPPHAYAGAEPIAPAAPPAAVAPPPSPPPAVDLPAATEAIGLPGVHLDGPNGIQAPGTAAQLQADADLGAALLKDGIVSHGMTRGEQFNETAGRG